MDSNFTVKKRSLIKICAIWAIFGAVSAGVWTAMYLSYKADTNLYEKASRAVDLKAFIASTPQRLREAIIRDNEDYATAPILDASGGADGAAVYFVGDNEVGYTILRDVTQRPDSEIGYVYVDPKTKGVIVQIGNVRVGVK